MPYIETYVEPEILFLYEGVPICVAYDEGQANDPHQYLYTIGLDSQENSVMFDVRNLSQFGGDPHKPIPGYARGRGYHGDVIREAISHGELDDLWEEAGLIPGLGAWPIDMDDLDANQALMLARSYSNYIQDDVKKNSHFGIWMPATINDYYRTGFEQELRDAKEERYQVSADIFAYKVSLLGKGIDEAAEDVSDVIAQIDKAKSLLKDDEEDAG